MALISILPATWRLGDKTESREAKVGDFVIPANGLIGKGGNGYAYLARHPTLGDVVLKIDKFELTRQSMQYMEQEVRAHDILSRHPNCSQLVTCLLGAMVILINRKRHAVFVLERMDGDAFTLISNARKTSSYPVSDNELLELCLYVHLSMVDQVRFIHTRGLVHGDVKPPNVLYRRIASTGHVELKMSDLGSACNPTRDCKNQYGCTHFYRSRAYANKANYKVMDPPSKLRRDNDFFGCAVSLPVLMMAANLIPYVTDDWSEKDRGQLAIDMDNYRSGMPIVDAALNAVYYAILREEYTDQTYASVKAAFERLKATQPPSPVLAPVHVHVPSARGVKLLSSSALQTTQPIYTISTAKTESMESPSLKTSEKLSPISSPVATQQLKRDPPASSELPPPPPKKRANYDIEHVAASKVPAPWIYKGARTTNVFF